MAKLVDASNLNFDDYYNRAGSIPALSTFINLKNNNYESKEINSCMGSKRKNGKSKSYWINSNTFNSLVLPKEAFPNVKWEDNEPTRVYIRIA